MIMESPGMSSRGLLTCLLLPLLLWRKSGVGGQELKVLQSPGPLSVSAGETLTLNCTLIGTAVAGGVKWFKGLDRSQAPFYQYKGPPPPRVTIVAAGSDTDFTIRISNIRPEDAGTYYCVKFKIQAGGETEFKSGKGTEVLVIATPSQPSISPPPGRVERGASATFSCTSAGFSPPAITVTWLKDGRGLSARQPIVQPPGDSTSYEVTSTVDVRLTEMDVKSQLTCQIQHSTLKAPLQQTFLLGDVLRVPPTVQVETTSPPPPIQLNALVMITCKAERFYPSDATLVWLENGKETGQGKTDPVTQDSNGLFSLKSSLEVNATEEKNMTEFTCRVEHDSQPPVNGSLELKIGVQPPKDGDPFVPEEKTIIIVVALVCALLVVLVIAVIYLIKARQSKGKDSTSVRLHESEKISGGTSQEPDPNNVTYADLNFDKEPKKSPRQVVEVSQQSEYASIQAAQPAANNDNVTYADLDMVHLSKGPKRPAPKPEEASSEYASVQRREEREARQSGAATMLRAPVPLLVQCNVGSRRTQRELFPLPSGLWNSPPCPWSCSHTSGRTQWRLRSS
ncbi:tyrosine-protein phosphatase non-receptor type substrate 1-like isoform X2 [Hemicordylus capensis]|uniref:tyrosine-protein phosphatase non-receptor type substrate 1-like isoform X2 n=1 Tax=Hemicordylus capensis TaxID=884348 RepID=UPI002302ECD9|nr:tyrosine-protein phosphatase non-receptor type substrate 1-like isoform X2 [Hemicordylus capensis]